MNAFAPISVSVDGSVKLCRESIRPNACSPMEVTPSGIVRLVTSFAQAKALLPMEVSVDGSKISVSPSSYPQKANSSIRVIPSGMTSLEPLHSAKA